MLIYYFMAMSEDKKSERQIQSILTSKELSKPQVDILKDLEKSISSEGKKLNTALSSLYPLKSFCEFTKKPFNKITKKDVVGYLNNTNKKYKETTFKQHQSAIKLFFKWYYENYMKWKPNHDKDYPEIVSWIKVKASNGNGKIPEELLTQEDIKKLINSTSLLRNKALIMLLYDGALRISEATNLKVKNLVFDSYGGYIVIPKGKTGMRKVRLTDSIPYLKNYLNTEHLDKKNTESPLFINIEQQGLKRSDFGNALSNNGVRAVLSKLAVKCNLGKKIYPHLFRHSKLTEMAKDFTEQELKIFAGWTSSSNMPSIYVHLSGSDVEDKILEKKGLKEQKTREEKNKLEPKRCIDPSCNHNNPATNRFCEKCHRPIDTKTILDIEGQNKRADDVVKVTMDKHGKLDRELLKETIKEMIKEGELKI